MNGISEFAAVVGELGADSDGGGGAGVWLWSTEQLHKMSKMKRYNRYVRIPLISFIPSVPQALCCGWCQKYSPQWAAR